MMLVFLNGRLLTGGKDYNVYYTSPLQVELLGGLAEEAASAPDTVRAYRTSGERAETEEQVEVEPYALGLDWKVK